MRIVNVEMAEAWNGVEGEQWSRNAAHYEGSTRLLWARFLELVPVPPETQALDIGCGNGRSACDVAARASAGDVLAVDLSGPMLARARERAAAAGLTNVRFERGDAQVHPFETASRDLAISTFGVMFFSDPVAAFGNIRSALRPGGRLAVLVWQGLAHNPWIRLVRDALAAGRDLPLPPEQGPGPLGLSNTDRTRAILSEAGFADISFTGIEEPMDYGTDVDDAFEFASNTSAARAMLQDLDDSDRAEALSRLRSALEEARTPDGVRFGSSAWLIRAANG
ncbi:MAG TPA: methyltransferase domain-containing protein [Mycobacteriales bacterium]|nr:methyltransferase domain-containing protein [Mycobacteriales bacterium]